MERLFARLERRLGRFAIPNVTYFIAAGMALAFVLTYVRPGIEERLVLDMGAVRRGEVWRLITFVFLPPPTGSLPLPRPILMMFGIYFVWMMGTNLEQEWGAFKLNAFYLLGMLGTTLVAALLGGAGNFFLLETLFLAYATIFPLDVHHPGEGEVARLDRGGELVLPTRDGRLGRARGDHRGHCELRALLRGVLAFVPARPQRPRSTGRATRRARRCAEAYRRAGVRDLRRERGRRHRHPRVLLRQVRRSPLAMSDART